MREGLAALLGNTYSFIPLFNGLDSFEIHSSFNMSTIDGYIFPGFLNIVLFCTIIVGSYSTKISI